MNKRINNWIKWTNRLKEKRLDWSGAQSETLQFSTSVEPRQWDRSPLVGWFWKVIILPSLRIFRNSVTSYRGMNGERTSPQVFTHFSRISRNSQTPQDTWTISKGLSVLMSRNRLRKLCKVREFCEVRKHHKILEQSPRVYLYYCQEIGSSNSVKFANFANFAFSRSKHSLKKINLLK